MKTFFAVFAALLASAFVSDAATVHIHSESVNDHHMQERVVTEKMLAKKQDMFYRMAHMKSTPWDAQPAEKTAKCKDLCLLDDYWKFQQVRNCINRPTSLCTPYKMGLSAMEVVLTVAECDCGGDNSTSSSASYSAGDEA